MRELRRNVKASLFKAEVALRTAKGPARRHILRWISWGDQTLAAVRQKDDDRAGVLMEKMLDASDRAMQALGKR